MRGFACGTDRPGPEGPPGRVRAPTGAARRAGFGTPADGVAGALPGVGLGITGDFEAVTRGFLESPRGAEGRDAEERGAPGRKGADMPSLSR